MTENTHVDINDAINEALADLTAPEVETELAAGTADVEEIADEAEDVEALDEDNLEAQAEEVSDDEFDGEPESDDETDDDDSDEEDAIITLDADMEVIIDGQRVKVADALQMRSDYTRKTQELSEERASFESEREQMSEQMTYLTNLEQAWDEDPVQVIASMANSTEDPVEAIAQTVKDLAKHEGVDGNLVVLKTVVELIGSDLLDEEFRMQMGFDDEVVAKIQQQVKQDSRIARLEREARRPKAEQPAKSEGPSETAIAEARAEIDRQWSEVVSSEEALQSLDEEALHKVRLEVARFALDKGGIPIDVAYTAMTAAKLKAEQAASKAKAEAARKAKKKTRASAKPSNGSSASTPRNPGDLTSAIMEAMQDLQGNG